MEKEFANLLPFKNHHRLEGLQALKFEWFATFLFRLEKSETINGYKEIKTVCLLDGFEKVADCAPSSGVDKGGQGAENLPVKLSSMFVGKLLILSENTFVLNIKTVKRLSALMGLAM